MDMRQCKECGKLFVPKGREQYCSDIHYRPCPVCGKPVEAKYLSDPARRCDDCKKVHKKAAIKPINEAFQKIVENRFDGHKYIRKFVSEEYRIGLEVGHDYEIEIDGDIYGYILTAVQDITSGLSVDKQVRFSSMIGIDQCFAQVSR